MASRPFRGARPGNVTLVLTSLCLWSSTRAEAPATSSAPAAAPAGARPANPTATPASPLANLAIPPESPPVPLEEALKGVKGHGTLMARIDVETKGLRGTVHCSLFELDTPIAVANFVALARGLRPFQEPGSGRWVKRPLYDGTLFHRVVPNFLIQGGDPSGTGRGGPGYQFDDEIRSTMVFDRAGVLAMANRGLDRATGHGTNGSQFFITDRDTPWLDGRDTIFGRCEDLDLVHRIARQPVQGEQAGIANAHRPITDVVIKKVTIVRQ